MTFGKLWIATAAVVLTLSLASNVGWATRAIGETISGAITSSPSASQIEVGHQVYRIQANSPAARNARSFYLGQVVDLVLSRPAVNQQPEVVSIAVHAGN